MESTSEELPVAVVEIAPESGRFATRAVGLFRGGLRELQVATERRVPFLDGLRAVAVLLVLNYHMSNAFANHNGANRYTNSVVTRDGWMGVDLFFVLSGYFIGSQLWRELGKTGTVSLKQFMIRRGLRIWPLYFFVFALVFLYSPAGAAARQYGWTDVVFLTNYVNHGIVEGGWSLCTEEQFYLVTPLALLLIGRRSMRAYRWGLGGLLVVVLAARAITFFAISGHLMGKDPTAWLRLYYPFHTHCDGLIAGLIVANLATAKERFGGLLARPALLVGLSFLLLVGVIALRGDILQFTGLAIFFASLVWWGLQSGTKLFGQHIFYLLSRLSFGMYLNNAYFTPWVAGRLEPALGLSHINPMLGAGAGFVLLTGLSIVLAAVTFLLVEHPFLVLRTALLQRTVPHLTAH
jgi:peptidoglycan/LPS O-acetylase OafA/YrhL